MRVTLQPGGESFETEAGESVLDAALRSGLNMPHSCRGGSCMSCRARLRSGSVNYPAGMPPALTEAEAEAGFALLCMARATSDLVIEARPMETPGDIRIRRLPCRVERLEKLSGDVMAVHLKLPSVEPFVFLAGQYIDILLSDGRRRSFSIASPPSRGTPLELHVRRVPGGSFTTFVFEDLKERALLRMEGPLGGFFLREDGGAPIVMVAGGTGLAPLQSMLEEGLLSGLDRRVHLYWGVRTQADLYAMDRIARWERKLEGFRFEPVLSEPGDDWSGRTGWVHQAVLDDYPDLSGVAVYASGPPPMIAAIQSGFPEHGLRNDRLFFDSFEFAADTAALAGGP
jgi:CDP-4-dehydro-6-deoxyglucose reductase